MAGGACKLLINGGIGALTKGLEIILTNPAINMGKIPDRERKEMIQRLADCDIAAYTGGEMPKGGVSGIALELQRYDLLSDDIWEIYARPIDPR